MCSSRSSSYKRLRFRIRLLVRVTSAAEVLQSDADVRGGEAGADPTEPSDEHVDGDEDREASYAEDGADDESSMLFADPSPSSPL